MEKKGAPRRRLSQYSSAHAPIVRWKLIKGMVFGLPQVKHKCVQVWEYVCQAEVCCSITHIGVNSYCSPTGYVFFDLIVNTSIRNKAEYTQQQIAFILLWLFFQFSVSHYTCYFNCIMIILL